MKNLIELNASDSDKIKNVNHMTNLKILYANNNCGIIDDGISDLDLIYIFLVITEINHMKNLELLYVEDDYNTNNESISELNAYGNYKITNVNYMTNLRVSVAEDICK